MTRGCIYIARNDEINPPNLYKIGLTEFAEPDKRMKTLSEDSTNWRGKYEAKVWVFVDDVHECEKKIHYELRDNRDNQGSEFFWGKIDDLAHAVLFHLRDKIIPGFGITSGFDIDNISEKTLNLIKTKKLSSIFELFDFVNKGLMSHRLIRENNNAFMRALILVILNYSNKIIDNYPLEENYFQYNFFKDKKNFTILCEQLKNLTDNNLYLFNHPGINDPKHIQNQILSKKSIKKESIINISDIIYRNMNKNELNLIIKKKLKNTPFYKHCYYHQRLNYLKEIRYADEIAEKRKKFEEEEEKKRLEEKLSLKLLKEKENEIKIKNQKKDQKLRKIEKEKYINTLKSLDLTDMLRYIISDHKYGLGVIPKEFFKAGNFDEFQKKFLDLKILEQKKFKEILGRNRQVFFKDLNKNLRDKEELMRIEWREFINSDLDEAKFKNLYKNFKLADDDLEIIDIPYNNNCDIKKVFRFSKTNNVDKKSVDCEKLYDEFFFKAKHTDSIQNLRNILAYLVDKSESESNAIEDKITNFFKIDKKKEIKYEYEIRFLMREIVKNLKTKKQLSNIEKAKADNNK